MHLLSFCSPGRQRHEPQTRCGFVTEPLAGPKTWREGPDGGGGRKGWQAYPVKWAPQIVAAQPRPREPAQTGGFDAERIPVQRIGQLYMSWHPSIVPIPSPRPLDLSTPPPFLSPSPLPTSPSPGHPLCEKAPKNEFLGAFSQSRRRNGGRRGKERGEGRGGRGERRRKEPGLAEAAGDVVFGFFHGGAAEDGGGLVEFDELAGLARAGDVEERGAV
ncbi:MAG: hypothetical protein JWQ19_604 [Subtercola sp.]|nr:hypothetical protein [Subtercola sp.]